MKQKKRILLLITILGIMLFGMVGCKGVKSVFDNSTTIDLNKYIKIETTGYNTMGKAEVSFDYVAFTEDYSDKIEVVANQDEANDHEINLELNLGSQPYAALVNCCVEFKADKTDNLSNGDVIKITWNCDDKNAKAYFNCKLKYSDIEQKVEGLEEVGTFNPFEHVEVKFEGIAPNGTATVKPNYDKKEMQYINFSIDKSHDLSNGDVVVVTAEVDDEFMQKFNAIPNPTSKEFTVEGINSYVTSASEIDESALNEMKKQAEDVYMAHVAREWGESDELESLTYAGYYFLSAKSDSRYGDRNYMYMVYKVDAIGRDEHYPHYTYIKFKDIIIDETGKCEVDLSKGELTSHTWDALYNGIFDRIYYYGYSTLDELYNDCVLKQIDKYTYEKNITE